MNHSITSSTGNLYTPELIQHLNLFLQEAPIGFAFVDDSFRFININRMLAETINGRTIEEHLGRTVEEVLGEDVWLSLSKYYRTALEGHPVADVEIHGPDTQNPEVIRHFFASYYPVSLNGKNVGVGLFVRDVSERKRVGFELENYRRRLESSLQAGHIGLFDWDLTTNRLWWSAEQERIFGFEPGSFDGTPEACRERVHPEDRERVSDALLSCIAERHTQYEDEFRVIHPDGSVHWISTKATIEFNDQQQGVRVQGVDYDISQRKQLEEAQSYLAKASQILSTSLDYEVTLQSICDLAIPDIADWCSVDLLEDGKPQLVAISHKDPDKVKWARQLREENPPQMDQDSGMAKVIKTGTSEFYPYISEELIIASAETEEQLALLRQLNLTAIIIVPLKIQGITVGAVTLVNAESRRMYTEQDLHMAEQLAAIAGLAIDNALLYRHTQEERERLETLLAGVPSVVWESWEDPATAKQLNFVNRYMEKLLGYSVSDWLSNPNFWLSIIHPDDRERIIGENALFYRNGTGGVYRFRWVKKDGDIVWVESQSELIKNLAGKPVGMRGVTIDISQRIELEKRKDEFISLASHELKTPVTSIKAFTQILASMLEKNGQQEMLPFLKKMDIQLNKLNNLIGDLLDVTRIQQGKLAFHQEWFDLNMLIHDSAEVMKQISSTHQIEVQGQVDKKVFGDQDRIGQVLTNLMSNAMKYSPHANRISIIISETPEHVVVGVQDEGIGIPKQHQSRIFERFYRVSDKQDRRFPGLGIGLYVSSQIIERHGGTMWVESKEGEGATFFFTLPWLDRARE